MGWEEEYVERKKRKTTRKQTQRPPTKWGGRIIDNLSPGYSTKKAKKQTQVYLGSWPSSVRRFLP